jgi:hypothetical protein
MPGPWKRRAGAVNGSALQAYNTEAAGHIASTYRLERGRAASPVQIAKVYAKAPDMNCSVLAGDGVRLHSIQLPPIGQHFGSNESVDLDAALPTQQMTRSALLENDTNIENTPTWSWQEVYMPIQHGPAADIHGPVMPDHAQGTAEVRESSAQAVYACCLPQVRL